MSCFRTGDPHDDFDRRGRLMAIAEAEAKANLPVCEDCEQRIVEDHYFKIEGEILCEECVIKRYRYSTDNYSR